jgi:IMP dehydrogenase
MREALSFDDVLLEPQHSDILSRSEVDISTAMSEGQVNVKFRLPVISAPMDTVTEDKMALAIGREGGLGIIHRYNSIEDQANLVLKAKEQGSFVGAAIGVTGDFLERAAELKSNHVDVLCVDVAHGHHVSVRHALETLRNTFGDSVSIMAGNVATLQAFNDLADWGAHAIRVGIGGGSICSTRIQTGHGIPTFQSVLDCGRSDRDAALIADGGIRTSGDMVKALAAGADFVMVGSMLAGTNETPGEVMTIHGNSPHKVYRGMASKEAQSDWRGHVSSIEGVAHTVPYRGSVSEVLHEMAVGIRSGLSYSGARSIQELQAKARFIRQTSAGAIESSTHIKGR